MQYLNENESIPQCLEATIKNNPKLKPYFDSEFQGSIKPKNCCGFLSVDEQSYFIIPKITNSNSQNLNIFIYMLMFAYDIKLKNEDIMQGVNAEYQILELFIKLFSDALLEEFKKGVFKQYITMQENLKMLRGKYIIEQNINNFYHQNIYCEYDEFSMDNELNRFFLYAINLFKRYSSYSNLYRCEAVLDEVSYFNIDFKTININFDRMNIRYKKSYEVALMILQKLVPMTQKGADRSFAFLFDMAEVFEKFVGKIYKDIDSKTQLQKKEKFGDLELIPDIMTTNEIIDTKYKKVNYRENLSVQDKYQMFVYGANFKVKDTMLLYPKHLVDIDDDLELGKGDDLIRLKLKSLDLEYDGGYGEFVSEIRNRLEEV